MKKIVNQFLLVFFITLMAMAFFSQGAFALQRFEDENVSIITKLCPQYLGWKLEVGSTTQTVPWYYKISAIVTGIGETSVSPVTTAYSTYGPLSSTNSVRIMWAPVNGATSYQLYKSVDNSSFYLLTNSAALTYVDYGATLGAAFSAASPRGGNLTVENNIAVGGDVTIAGDLTVSGTLSPYTTGTFTAEDATLTYGLAAATAVFSGAVSAASYGAVSGTSGAFSTTLAVTQTSTLTGNVYTGAANFKSTNTASTGAWAFPATVSVAGASTFTGAVTASTTTFTGGAALLTKTFAQLNAMAPSPAQAGVMYDCSDCTSVAISSGSGVGAFVNIGSTTVHIAIH